MTYIADSRDPQHGFIFPAQDHGFRNRGLDPLDRTSWLAVRVLGRRTDAGELGDYVHTAEGDVFGAFHWPPSGGTGRRSKGAWTWVFPAVLPGLFGGDGPEGEVKDPRPPPPEVTPPNLPPPPEITPSSRDHSASGPGKGPTIGGPPPTVNPGGPTTGGPPPPGKKKGMLPEPADSFTGPPPITDVVPIRGKTWMPDFRFKKIVSTEPKVGSGTSTIRSWPRFPRGYFGLVVQGTDEHQQIEQFHPTDPRLIATNRGGHPLMSTLVADVTSGGHVDVSRMAPLHAAFRVVKTPTGILSLRGRVGNTLALQLGLSGLRDVPGLLYADKGGKSSFYGMPSVRDGGPFDVTPGCKHQVGRTAIGEPISPVHFSTMTFWRNAVDSPQNKQHDGPLEFEIDYPQPPEMLFPVRVHIGWDQLPGYNWPRDGGGASRQVGQWRLWTTTFISGFDGLPPFIAAPVPPVNPPVTDDPQGGGFQPPDPPRGPGGGVRSGAVTETVPETPSPHPPGVSRITRNLGRGLGRHGWPTTFAQGNSRALLARDSCFTHAELALPAVLFRPVRVSAGAVDVACMSDPPIDAVDEYLRTAPVTLRMIAFGKQGNASAGGTVLSTDTSGNDSEEGEPWGYTQFPGASRSRSGTAPGGVAFLRPELDHSDADDDYDPDNLDLSASSVVVGPGVDLAFGVPDLASGKVRSGVSFGIAGGGTALVINRLSALGVPTPVATIPFGTGLAVFDETLEADLLKTTQAETYAITNPTVNRALDVSASTLDQVRQVLGTLVADLQAGKLPKT